MDADMIRASSEDQMELLMMQLDKLNEYSDAFNTSGSTEIEFSGGSAATNETPPPPLFQYPNLNTPNNTIMTPFLGSPIQEPKLKTEIHERLSSQKNRDSMEAMREMTFRIAVMQPIQSDPEALKPPKRRNVKISKDPQSVAARHRRERIGERIRILQRLVPGGTKMDTASMLDEAVHYMKFLKKQVQYLEKAGADNNNNNRNLDFGLSAATMANMNYSLFGIKAFQPAQMVGALQMLR